jgi:hypothetical protein
LIQTYFAVGTIKSSPLVPTNHDGLAFGMYWYSEPPFDAAKVAGDIQKVFFYMSDFFQGR